MSAALQLPFIDPLEPRILPRSERLFWTLNIKAPGGRLKQHPYRLTDLDYVLRHVNRSLDVYQSQAFFDRPCRVALNVSWMTHAYVDLDFYKLPDCPESYNDASWIRSHFAARIMTFCEDEGIFPPSLIVFSGRGVYLKWLWLSPIPRKAAGKAVAVNKGLVKVFAPFGADPACVDVSRILRVVGTVNSKNGERAEVIWRTERDGAVVTYDFELFADEILPYTREQIRGYREAAAARTADIRLLPHEWAKRAVQPSRRPGSGFVREHWHWGVLEDLRMLKDLRGGTIPEGYRDLFGHLGACALAQVIPAAQLWPEIQNWARITLPSDYVHGPEFLQHASSLLARAKRAATGEKTEFKGRLRSPIYTYTSARQIELLKITPAEMQHMTRLIDKEEHQRRRVAARRAKGVMPRGEYEARSEERRIQAKVMASQGQSLREIAKAMEISKSHVQRLIS